MDAHVMTTRRLVVLVCTAPALLSGCALFADFSVAEPADGGGDARFDVGGDGGLVRDADADAEAMPGDGGDIRDAGEDAVDAGPTSVRYLREGAAVAGVSVIFQDEEGGLIAVASTSPAGVATYNLDGPAMVTVVYPETGPGATFFTIAGVQPGETVTFEPVTSLLGESVGRVAVDPPSGLVSGATNYLIDVGGHAIGGSTPQRRTISLYADSLEPGSGLFNVVATAEDAAGSILAYAVELDQRSDTTEVMLGAWQTDFLTNSVEVSNAPAAGSLQVDLTPVEDEVRYPSLSLERTLAVVLRSPAQTLSFSVPRFGDGAAITTALAFDSGGGAWATRRFLGRPPLAAVIDLGAELLPGFRRVLLEATADPTRPLVRWSTVSRPETDFAQVTLASSDFDFRWIAVVPPIGEGSFRFPELPAVLRGSTPDQWSGTGNSPYLVQCDLGGVSGFDELRQRYVVRSLLGHIGSPEAQVSFRSTYSDANYPF